MSTIRHFRRVCGVQQAKEPWPTCESTHQTGRQGSAHNATKQLIIEDFCSSCRSTTGLRGLEVYLPLTRYGSDRSRNVSALNKNDTRGVRRRFATRRFSAISSATTCPMAISFLLHLKPSRQSRRSACTKFKEGQHAHVTR